MRTLVLACLPVIFLFLLGAPAHAQTQDDAGDADAPRLRGAIGAQLGPGLVLERGANFGLTAAGQVGLQASDAFAVYGTSSLGFFFIGTGSSDAGAPVETVNGGMFLDLGVVAELTVADRFSIGVGPDAAIVATFGDTDETADEAARTEPGDVLLGGQFRVAVYPMVEREAGRARRKSLAVGADIRVLRGDGFSLRDRDATVVMPMLYAGVAWM